MKKNIRKNKGFTLIEIMVAVSIFAIVMVIALGAVLAIVSANRKAQSLSSVINNLNFAFEGMVRDLRTGNTYDCIATSGTPSANDCSGNPTPGASHILFYSSQSGHPVYYRLVDDSGNKRIGKIINGEPESFLTAPEVKIDSLTFYVVGATKTDDLQPHILVVLKGHYGEKSTEKTEFNLQTLVSQRKLDIR